jgi:hypothetical protein
MRHILEMNRRYGMCKGLYHSMAAHDAAGNLVSVAIVDASQCIADLGSVTLELAG